MRDGTNGVHGKHCNCTCDICVRSIPGVCMARCGIFQGLIDIWTSILCPTKLDAIFHDLKCLEGQCDFCGIDMLVTYPIEKDIGNEKLMSGKCYEKVVHGRTKVGSKNKVLKLHFKETTTTQFWPTLNPSCVSSFCTILWLVFKKSNIEFAWRLSLVKVSCLLWILQKITLLWGHKWNKTNQWCYFRKGLHVLFPKTNFLI